MSLAEHEAVVASEDIYSESGIKLLAKGKPLSPVLRERLLLQRLRRPLEACLAPAQGVAATDIGQIAHELIESWPILAPLCLDEGRPWPLSWLAQVPVNQVTALLLSVSARAGAGVLRHAVLVTLVALGLARRMQASPEVMRTLAIAGLLHDVGELYVAPEVLSSRADLSLDDWRALAVHPLTGAKVIEGIAGLGAPVALAVLQHHERHDGTGYPRRLAGAAMSPAAKILATAEAMAGLIPGPEESSLRASVAFKVITSDHAPAVVAAVRSVLNEMSDAPDVEMTPLEAVVEIHRLIAYIGDVFMVIELAGERLATPGAQALLGDIEARFTELHRAFSRTGLGGVTAGYEVSWLDYESPDEGVAEVAAVAREIRWRLRELARDIALRASSLADDERTVFSTLIGTLTRRR